MQPSTGQQPVSPGPDGLYHSTYPEVLGVCVLLHRALSPARVSTMLTRKKAQGAPPWARGAQGKFGQQRQAAGPSPTSACYSLLCGARTGGGLQAGGLALS